MSGMHFNHVETRCIGAFHRIHVLCQHSVHVLACHGAGHGAVGVKGNRAGGEQRPSLGFWKGLIEDLGVPLPWLKG